MSEPSAITLLVNGDKRRVAVAPTRTLLDVLRDDLNLIGTKCGCNQGVCGTCTVLCDGLPIRACLALAVTMPGREITTIEAAQEDKLLSLVLQSFVDTGAVQCGFCTPGMIMSTAALLAENNAPSDHDIREALSGNLCRCTGYVKVIEAVQTAVRSLAASKTSAA
jgi:carbon-monoxide dehydrogenase small subunit